MNTSFFRVGLALLACERSESYRLPGCVSIIQYAVEHLGLSRQKANELLRVSRSLDGLPVLREAFRTGKLGWGKMRELTRVATPANERQWALFAQTRSTDEVAKEVVMSPRAFNASVAAAQPKLEFSAGSTDGVGGDGQTLEPHSVPLDEGGLFSRTEQNAAPQLIPFTPLTSFSPEGRSSFRAEQTRPAVLPVPLITEEAVMTNESVPPPATGRKIRLIIELTPEQFVRYEQAEVRIRRQLNRRVSRSEILMLLAESKLSASKPRALAKLPVVMIVDGATGAGWYQSSQGLLPATPSQVEMTMKKLKPIEVVGQQTLFESKAEEPLGTRGEVGTGGGREGCRLPGLGCSPEALGVAVPQAGQPEARACAPAKGPTRRRKIPLETYRALVARSGGRCESCGRFGCALHVHHDTPLSRGGTNALENLKLECGSCHFHGEHAKDFLPGSAWAKARDRKRFLRKKERARQARRVVRKKAAETRTGSEDSFT